MHMITILFEFVILCVLLRLRLVSITCWLISILMFQMSYISGNQRIYMEIIEDYPIEDCVKPKKFQFLYKKLLKLSYKDIPKEMYYCETIKVYAFIIYTIISVPTFFINEYLAGKIGVIYICFYGILSLLCAEYIKDKSFFARYKLLNRHNIKYMFYPVNQPYPHKIGKGQIIYTVKKGSKTFATVKIVETGEIKEKVLFIGKHKQLSTPVHSIYEICNVFYIN